MFVFSCYSSIVLVEKSDCGLLLSVLWSYSALLSCGMQGMLDILTEQAHIKVAVSRIVVEIAKREWPQEWQSLIVDLNSIYAQGVSVITLSFDYLLISCM